MRRGDVDPGDGSGKLAQLRLYLCGEASLTTSSASRRKTHSVSPGSWSERPVELGRVV